MQSDVDPNDDDDHIMVNVTDYQTTPSNQSDFECYLRDIWSQLQVGHNGYLTIDELYMVCQHIGMIQTNDDDGDDHQHDSLIVQQLFDKLDNDQDGRISFNEFMDGLFNHVHMSNHEQAMLLDTDSATPALSNKSLLDPGSTLDHCAKTTTTRHGSCSSAATTPTSDNDGHHLILYNQLCSYNNHLTFKANRDGYMDCSTLIDLWDSFGLIQQQQHKQYLLKCFGLSSDHHHQCQQQILASQLWSQLMEYTFNMLFNPALVITTTNNASDHHHQQQILIHQVSLATILNEFAELKHHHDQLISKTDRLQELLQQANSRAELLAMEVDEQHARLENSSQTKLALLQKKYMDQIRVMEMDFAREKDLLIIQSCHLRQDIHRQMHNMQSQINKFRCTVKRLEEENNRLENECNLIKFKNNDFINSLADMQTHVRQCEHLQKKIDQLETYDQCAYDKQQIQSLTNDLNTAKLDNKALQDQIDELLVEKQRLLETLVVNGGQNRIAVDDQSQQPVIIKSKKRKRKRRKKKKKETNKQMQLLPTDNNNNSQHQLGQTSGHLSNSCDQICPASQISVTAPVTKLSSFNETPVINNQISPTSEWPPEREPEPGHEECFDYDFDDDFYYDYYNYNYQNTAQQTITAQDATTNINNSFGINKQDLDDQDDDEEEEEEDDDKDDNEDDHQIFDHNERHPSLMDEIHFDEESGRPMCTVDPGQQVHGTWTAVQKSLDRFMVQLLKQQEPVPMTKNVLQSALNTIKQAIERIDSTMICDQQSKFDMNNNPS